MIVFGETDQSFASSRGRRCCSRAAVIDVAMEPMAVSLYAIPRACYIPEASMKTTVAIVGVWCRRCRHSSIHLRIRAHPQPGTAVGSGEGESVGSIRNIYLPPQSSIWKPAPSSDYPCLWRVEGGCFDAGLPSTSTGRLALRMEGIERNRILALAAATRTRPLVAPDRVLAAPENARLAAGGGIVRTRLNWFVHFANT